MELGFLCWKERIVPREINLIDYDYDYCRYFRARKESSYRRASQKDLFGSRNWLRNFEDWHGRCFSNMPVEA